MTEASLRAEWMELVKLKIEVLKLYTTENFFNKLPPATIMNMNDTLQSINLRLRHIEEALKEKGDS